ncbi:MAG: DEAD/DEAH box helicase [Chloroflexota bacterium]
MRASSPRVDERAGPVSGGFVAVALETAGPDPMRLEVVEAALVAVSGDGGRERLETLIRPSHDISPEWLDAAGLERSDFALAPDWAEFAPRFRRLIAGRPLVAMSAATLRAALDAAGMYLPNPVYDAGDLATFLLHDQPSYRLEAIAAALGIDPPRGRGAIATAETTAAVFSELLRRVDRFDGTMLEQLAFLTRFGGLPEAEVFAAAAKTAPSGPLFAAGIGEERIGAPELAFLNHRERPEPLRETGSRGKIDPAAVSSALATGGPLSRTVRDYERRPQQEAMALNVAKAFSSDQHLLVEAGTGTGKSLAYLLPAALHARETGENVVISTNTLALQDQLFRKDLPDLEAALGLDATDGLKATVLKGRQNYLCLRSWFSWQRSAPADPAEARLRARIMTWLPDTETGDRAELRLSAEEEAGWRNVAEDEDACVASRCPFFQRNQCFLYRARKKAEASHLVIVNHALLLSDAVSPSRILPEYERLIVDEAHHLEDQATTQFGHSISERDLADLADAVARRDGGMAGGCIAVAAAFLQTVAADEKSRLAGAEAGNRVLAAIGHADALRSGAARFFAAAHGLAVARGGGMDRSLRLVDAVRADPGWESVETLLLPLDGALRALDD